MKLLACTVAVLSDGVSRSPSAQNNVIAVEKWGIDPAQIPTWSSEDRNSFLHGSIWWEGELCESAIVSGPLVPMSYGPVVAFSSTAQLPAKSEGT